MEIKDFISEAMLQIIEGVKNANSLVREKGAFVPTKNITGPNMLYDSKTKNGDVEYYMRVDFDLAVVEDQINSETETHSMGGTIKSGLKIASIVQSGIDIGGESKNHTVCESKESAINRIKFSIPLAIPTSIKRINFNK